MKAKTNNIHVIFLLRKNVRSDIIKTILGYTHIAVLEILKKQKVAIISVRQEYKSTEGRQDYKIGLGITYRERRAPMDIEKSKDNYNKDGKSRFGVSMIQQTSIYSKSFNEYIILHWKYNKERELNIYTNVKISNRKKLQFKILVDSGCTYTRINKQLIKEEQIKMKPMNKLFEVFNADRTKNREVMRFAPLEL